MIYTTAILPQRFHHNVLMWLEKNVKPGIIFDSFVVSYVTYYDKKVPCLGGFGVIIKIRRKSDFLAFKLMYGEVFIDKDGVKIV